MKSIKIRRKWLRNIQLLYLFLQIFFSPVFYANGQNANSIVNIVAGDKTVSATHLHPYTNIWDMYRETADGTMQFQGQWFDTVVISQKDTKPVLQRRQTARYVNGNSRIHFDEAYIENLLPIHTIIMSRAKDSISILADVHFRDNHIDGFRYFNIDGTGEPAEIRTKFSLEPQIQVYEWHLWGILISSFPLTENYAARFLTHTTPGFNNSPFMWVTLAVLGSETIKSVKLGEVDCWKVKVDAEAPWTFWISKKNGLPPIMQIKIVESANSNLWWKPLSN